MRLVTQHLQALSPPASAVAYEGMPGIAERGARSFGVVVDRHAETI